MAESIFRKKFHLKSLTGFWIRLWVSSFRKLLLFRGIMSWHVITRTYLQHHYFQKHLETKMKLFQTFTKYCDKPDRFTQPKIFPYLEFFWPVFSRIWTKYWIRENTDQKKSEYGHFSCSVSLNDDYWLNLSFLWN